MTLDLNASATEQINWLATGQVTSEELLEAYIARAEKVNPALNTIVSQNLEMARHMAKDFDQRRASGENLGPLNGLPMTLKDSYDVDGLPAVCGEPALADRPPEATDAFVVEKLKAAGAIIWGKTNTPHLTGDIQTYNAVYGTTNNPYDTARTPGGSSGGAAAALAAGLTPLEVGSDIGGSLRTPAHNCGVMALKPTYGTISLKGHVPPMPWIDVPDPDLAVAGPMARTVDDLNLLFSILAPDAPHETIPTAIPSCRIAVWRENKFELGSEVAGAMDHLIKVIKDSGGRVKSDRPVKDGDHLIDVYQRLLIPIVTAGLPAATKFLFKCLRPFAKLFAKKGQMAFSNTILSATQTKEQISQTKQERSKLKAACDRFFENYDVLISPVTSVPAILHNNEITMERRKIDIDGQPASYMTLYQWISLATACHLPSVVIPIKQSAGGMPIGLQLIGREGSDRKILAIARLFANALAPIDQPQLG
ncbi:MAG: amidase family protein [Chloroflexota bacterium]